VQQDVLYSYNLKSNHGTN